MKYLTRSDSIDLLNLSVRSYQILRRADISTIGNLIDLSQEELMCVRHMGAKSAAEITAALKEAEIVEVHAASCNFHDCEDSKDQPKFMGEDGEIYHDILIEELGLTRRPYHCIKNAGIRYFSQLQRMSESDLYALSGMGEKSVSEILAMREKIMLLPAEHQHESYCAAQEDHEDLIRYILQDVIRTVSVNAAQLYEAVLSLFKQQSLPQESSYKLSSAMIKEIFHLPVLYTAMKETILNQLDQSPYGLEITELRKIIPSCLDDRQEFENLIAEMEREATILCRYNGIYEVNYPSVQNYVVSLLKEQDRHVLQMRLEGKTLDEIGKEYNLTRERVRQIVANRLKKAPKFSEDRYAILYQKYDISEADFLEAFKVPKITFHYLCCAYKHGNRSISELLEDQEMPDEFKRVAERILYKNYVVLNGERVLQSRSELSEYILRTAGVQGVTFEEFIHLYQMLLKDINQQDHPKLRIMDRGYANKLAASNRVLWKYGKKLRYYNIDSYDFTDLFETLDLKQYHNVEYSTLKFFREYPDLMKEYDIEDEYELHNLLKKICTQECFPDMYFKRMPNIEFGTADRDTQVMELLLSLSPVVNTVFAEAYEREYGVLSQTVLANYMKNFDLYFHAGIYQIEVPALSPIMISELQQVLTNDFYLLSDMQRIYQNRFPNADVQLLNPYTVKSLGFRVYANYVVSDRYSSAVEYFRTILTKEDVVDAKTFPKGVLSTISYNSEVYKLKSSFEIIEYEPLKYVSFRRLNSMGIDKALLEDYCKKVYAAVQTRYFTIHSLKHSGFTHDLDQFSFDEWFYASLLTEDKEHFSYRRMGKNKLFLCGNEDVYLTDFLQWLLNSQESFSIKICELLSILSDVYNILIDQYKIVEIVRGSSMHYDTMTQTIYANYDAYSQHME